MSRTRQLLKGLTALIATAGLVVGVPAALVTQVGWPLPTQVPTLDGIQLALRSGIDPQLLINTLAIIVWIVWTQLVVALGFEVSAVIAGRTSLRAPVLPGLQTAAARLVTTITLVAASLGPLRPAPAIAQPLPIAAAVEPEWHTKAAAPQPASRLKTADVSASPERHASTHPTYVVRRFDTLWRIAEATLGDGRRWQEIRDLNLGRPTSDGNTITPSSDRIPAGTGLLLPADAHLPEPTSDDPGVDPTLDEVTVEPGDHFWGIAEDALTKAWARQPTTEETARYWRQVVDANRDRLLPPNDPDLVYPGQVFALPPTPPSVPGDHTPPAPAVTGPASGEVTVEPGDNFWRIAERALEDTWGRQPAPAEIGAYWRAVIDANGDRLAPPHDPNIIHPGQVFELPAIPQDPSSPVTEPGSDTPDPTTTPDTDHPTATEPPPPIHPDVTTPKPTVEPSEAAPPVPPNSEPQPAQPSAERTVPPDTEPADTADTGDEAADSLLPTATTIAGLGVVAAGLIALINRLRRTQHRHRTPGTIPTPPPATAATVEATLRAAAAPTATDLIDLALRALAHQTTDSQTPPPQVVGVHLDPTHLRLLLWTPHYHPPDGWQVDDDGRSWTLPATIDPTALRLHADGTPAPYPAMVSVGHTDHGQLLLDLEHLGAVQITGTPDEVAATCHTIAIELAASPLADTLQVVCVGFGHDLAHLERVTVVDRIAEAITLVDDKTKVLAAETVTPPEGRLAPWGGDRWDPLVIIDPASTPPDGSSKLLAAAHRGRAISAIVGYPTGDRWRLHVADGTVRVDPLGYLLGRRNLTPTEQAGIANLTAAAKDLDGTPLPDPQPPANLETIPATVLDDAPLPPTGSPLITDDQALLFAGNETAPALEVRILGTVHLDGFTDRFPQPKCLELVTYLALHRRGADRDTLMEALWPEQPPSRRRINTLISRTRLALGADPEGELYLPNLAADGLYRLNPKVGCDLDRFTTLIQNADRASTDDQVATYLQAALELVEGPPFHGAGNDYTWAHTEGIVTHAIVAVDNAAHRLARLAVEAGDPDQATWASRQGLLATWACEECYRNLMRAAIAEGDQTALDAIYNELTTIVDADEGPDATSWLDPETVRLYEQHKRHRKRHAG